MIEIDVTRYAKVPRRKALQILERAELKPDKFTAHRDRTFTAKYLRDRQPIFASKRYEERMEIVADNAVAIFKRPSTKMDRGRYITLKFAVAALERLGLHEFDLDSDGKLKTEVAEAAEVSEVPKAAEAVEATKTEEVAAAPSIAAESSETSASTETPEAEVGDVELLTRLIGISRDMKQLASYAHELAEKKDHHNHIMVTLDELKKHAEMLGSGLQKLASSRQAS